MARARADLRRDAVELAVELAENALKENISQADQERLAREFLTAIEAEGSATNA